MDESRASGHAGHAHTADVSSDGVWLSVTWPFIRGQLPPAPARVIELGCGPAGGHVPALIRAGYDATGVDPEAPQGPAYVSAAFEEYRPHGRADAVVASVSLHHVDDPALVLDHVAELLAPDGILVAVEWISEDFDEATARWCFRHQLRGQAEPGAWLGGMYTGWAASGLGWDAFFRAWLDEHGLHAATAIRREIDARFAVTHLSTGPYYFPDFAGADADTAVGAEQAAIDAGQIRAGCLRYAGRVRPTAPDAARSAPRYEAVPIGRVSSTLTNRAQAPRQGDEGAPPAWLVIEPHLAEGIRDLRAGDQIIVLTWLDRARRDVLSARPRGEETRAPVGVFSTRSPDRPNPIGLHRVEILAVDGLRIEVSNLEALDATPVLDIKPVLDPIAER
jgi:tRNA-Thr(GGU) m(6)t(6)A37 methyltransferase TsaA